MKLISHRGNISAVIPERENSQMYIQEAIDAGYDVEIDVRYINGILYLGHDQPEYAIELSWLIERKHSLWIHTKNYAALSFLIELNLRVFFHQKEEHTIINHCNMIWSHNLMEADSRSVVPLISLQDITDAKNDVYPGFSAARLKHVYGVCSDFISELKEP